MKAFKHQNRNLFFLELSPLFIHLFSSPLYYGEKTSFHKSCYRKFSMYHNYFEDLDKKKNTIP